MEELFDSRPIQELWETNAPYLDGPIEKIIMSDHSRMPFLNKGRKFYNQDFLSMVKLNEKVILQTRKGNTPLGNKLKEIKEHRDIFKNVKEDKLQFIVYEKDNLADLIVKNHSKTIEQVNLLSKAELKDLFVSNFGLDFNSERIMKRKISVYNGEMKQFTELKKLNYGYIVQHLSHTKEIDAKGFQHSKLLKIEFLPYEDKNFKNYLTLGEMFQIVSGIIGGEPVYAERSIVNSYDGCLYFKMRDYLSDTVKKSLERYIEHNFNFKVKIRTREEEQSNLYKLPFSKSRPIYGFLNPDNLLKVNLQPILSIVENIKNSKPISSYRIETILGPIQGGNVLERRIETTSDALHLQDFYYGDGTRHEKTKKIALWCARHEKSFEEFYQYVHYYNNGSSKDMSNWNEEIKERNLKGYYYFAKRVVDPIDKTNFKRITKEGTEYTIIDSERKHIFPKNNLRTKLLTKYIKQAYNLKYQSKRQQGKWKSYFISDTLSVLHFMESKMINCDLDYEDKNYKDLESGVLFPKSIHKKVSTHLRLKTDIQKILSFLREFNIIEEIAIKGYTWSYKGIKFAKHYRLNLSLDKIKDLFNTLISYIQNSYSSLKKRWNIVLSSNINNMFNVCFGFSSIMKSFLYLEGNYLKKIPK